METEVISINNLRLVVNPTDIISRQKRRIIEEEYIRENSVFAHMGRYAEANFTIILQFNIDDQIKEMVSPDNLPIYIKLLCQLNNFPFLYIKSDRLKSYLTQTSTSNIEEMIFGLEAYTLRFSAQANNIITLKLDIKYFNYTPFAQTASFYRMTEDSAQPERTRLVGGISNIEYVPEVLDSILDSELFDRYFASDYTKMFHRLKTYQNSEDDSNDKYIGQTKIRSPQFFNEEPENGNDFKKVTITELDDKNQLTTGYIYAVWKDFGEFSVIGDRRSPITEISITRYNNFASHSMTAWAYPVLQYMGKGATSLDMQFSENSLDGYSLKYLKTMLGQLDTNQLDNYKYSQYNILKIDNIVVDLMPMLGFVLDNETIKSSSVMQEVDTAFFRFIGKDISNLLKKRGYNTANTRAVRLDADMMLDTLMHVNDRTANIDRICRSERPEFFNPTFGPAERPTETGHALELLGTPGLQRPGEWPTGLSDAYLADIEREHGLPPSLMYNVMMQESRGQMYNSRGGVIRSSAGAGGVFQIMPGTATLLNIRDVDDPVEAAEGAGRLLGLLSVRYDGDIPLMLAAYNRGEPALNRTIRLAGSSDWNVIRNHPTMRNETRAYVPAILESFALDTGREYTQAPHCNTQNDISAAEDQLENLTTRLESIIRPDGVGQDEESQAERQQILRNAQLYLSLDPNTEQLRAQQLQLRREIESAFIDLDRQSTTGNQFLIVAMRGSAEYVRRNSDRWLNSFEGEAYADLELGDRLGVSGLLSESGGAAEEVRDINPMFFMIPNGYIQEKNLSTAYSHASRVLAGTLRTAEGIDNVVEAINLDYSIWQARQDLISFDPLTWFSTPVYDTNPNTLNTDPAYLAGRRERAESLGINLTTISPDNDIGIFSEKLSTMVLYDTNKGSSKHYDTTFSVPKKTSYGEGGMYYEIDKKRNDILDTARETDDVLKSKLKNVDIAPSIKNTEEMIKIDNESQMNARGTYELDLVKQGVGNEDLQAQYHFPRGCQPFNRGINQAFPVLKMYLVEGDEDSIRYNVSSPEPEYYELTGVSSVKIIHQDDVSPIDVAIIKIANPGSIYTDHTVYMDLIRPEKNWSMRNTPDATSIPLDKVTLRSGNRIHIKAGYCVDIETEILTKDGWKDYKLLNKDDSVYSLDHETGNAKWDKVKKVNIFNVIDEEMVSIEGQYHSSLTTLNHRWPVYKDDNNKKIRSREWVQSKDLKTNHKIILSSKSKGINDIQKYSDSFIELIAWFWTEGNIRNTGIGRLPLIYISQNREKNKNNCKRIYDASVLEFGEESEKIKSKTTKKWRCRERARNFENVYVYNSMASKELLSVAPNRVVSRDFILSLTEEQLRLFIDISNRGDGYNISSYKEQGFIISQKDPKMLECIELASILLGYKTRIYKDNKTSVDKNGNNYNMTVLSVSYNLKTMGLTSIKPLRKKYTGVVWCPTTSTGTWLARRKGNAFFTGNSNDINKLEPMFNGIITEVHGEATLELVCESYGRELVAYEHGNDPEEDNFWGGSDTVEVLANFIYSGEIEHFGNIKLFPSLWDREAAERAKVTINDLFSSFGADALWMNIYIDDVVDGKYDYGFHPWDTVGTDKKWFPFFPIYKTTPWDAFKEMEFRHPGTLSKAALYGPRQTLFFGIKEQLYVFRDLHRALRTARNHIRQDETSAYLRDERLKPISDMHILSSDHNIISNTLKVVSDFNTVVDLAYYDSNWDIEDKDYKYYTVKMDDNLKPMAHRKGYCNLGGIHGAYSAYVYGSTYLRKEAEKMYDGKIIIIGNQNMKSGDYAYIDDSSRGISGVVKVKECIHHFDTENGFVTEIVPGLYAESSHADYSLLFSKLQMAYSHVVAESRIKTRKSNKSNHSFAKSAFMLDLMGLSNHAEDSTDFLHLASQIFTTEGAYAVANTGGLVAGSYLGLRATLWGLLNTPGRVGAVVGGATRSLQLAAAAGYIGAEYLLGGAAAATGKLRSVSTVFSVAKTGFKAARAFTPAGWAATIALSFVSAKIEEITLTRQPIRMFPLIMNGKPYIGGMWGYQENDFWTDTLHNYEETSSNMLRIWEAIRS